MTGHARWNRLPEPLRWTPHNLLGHGVGELVHLAGWVLERAGAQLQRQALRLHDWTMPEHKPGQGRG